MSEDELLEKGFLSKLEWDTLLGRLKFSGALAIHRICEWHVKDGTKAGLFKLLEEQEQL